MLRIESNIRALEKAMRTDWEKQLPFATALALTSTAKDVKANTEKRLPRVFDRPTPFTKKGVGIYSARKTRLSAKVFMKDAQADYLEKQEEGGTRHPKGKALLTPVGQRLNKYGNMPRGAVKRILARSDTFSGTVRGIGGIWQRTRGGGVKLLVAYRKAAKYTERFGFKDSAYKTTASRFPTQFERAMARALKSKR